MLDTAHVPPRAVESGAVSLVPHSLLLLRSDAQR